MIIRDKIVLGLGQAGCNIALFLKNFDWYSILIDKEIDVEDRRIIDIPAFFSLGIRNTVEDWEKDPPNIDFGFLPGNEILFVTSTCGEIASASLVLLEKLRHCKINLLLIQPANIELLSEEEKRLNRLISGVLQEMTRSGCFVRTYLVDNEKIEELLDGVPAVGYENALNEAIVPTFHLINELEVSGKMIAGSINIPPLGTRISTVGIVENLENHREHLFFDLDNVTDIVYYYAFNEERLKQDKTLLKTIRSHVSKKLNETKVRVSFRLYSTNFNHDYIYVVHHTSVVQKNKNMMISG